MTSPAMIEAVCDQLYIWHLEGRQLPHYVPACGKPHLLWLFDLHKGESLDTYCDGHGGINRYTNALAKQMTDGQCSALLGPHGWAFYRVLVIRREMREHENIVTANAGT